MIDDQAWMKSIRDNPADDGVRLGYADWLNDQGDEIPGGVEHAELIMLQMALKNNRPLEGHRQLNNEKLDEPEREKMEARVAALLQTEALRTKLLAPLDPLGINNLVIDDTRYEGGFLSHVAVTPESWQRAEELFRLAPGLTGITFTNFRNTQDIREFLASPLLRRLTTIDLPNPIQDQDAIALAASPNLIGLRSLSLRWRAASITGTGISAILQARNLRDLEHLNLSSTEIDGIQNDFIDYDIGQVNFPHLKSLRIEDHNLVFSVLPIAAGHFPNLESLALTGNVVDEDVIHAIADNQTLANVRSLDLKENVLADVAVQYLATSSNLKNVEHLDLSLNPIGDRGLSHFARSQTMLKLRELYLQHTHITAVGAYTLANSSTFCNLVTLDLSSNHIGDEGLAAIALSSNLSKLETLRVENMQTIGLETIASFAATPYLKKLRVLSLSHNNIGDNGLFDLSRGNFPEITHLQIERIGVSNVGVEHLARSPLSAQLTALNLSYNNIGPEGARAIADSPHFANLRMLNMRNTQIGASGARAIAESKYPPQQTKDNALITAGYAHLAGHVLGSDEVRRRGARLIESLFPNPQTGQNEGRT